MDFAQLNTLYSPYCVGECIVYACIPMYNHNDIKNEIGNSKQVWIGCSSFSSIKAFKHTRNSKNSIKSKKEKKSFNGGKDSFNGGAIFYMNVDFCSTKVNVKRRKSVYRNSHLSSSWFTPKTKYSKSVGNTENASNKNCLDFL